MRFRKDGPSIPDELLLARDEGRVVFFCGSGVSRARAGLSDFFGLAELVLERLRAPADHTARRLLVEAKVVEERTGLSGLISADRIFASLERDFTIQDVEAAVAHSLRPPEDVDTSAHKLLVDLATTREGHLRLVTTNFDRLFERCRRGAPVWHGPRLPDPRRADEMNGLIYLHGRVNESYSGSEKEGLILSSPQFGEAYLAAGWATRFVREVLDRYVVVFVGYSADDPPMQYLLEALTITGRHPHGAYAFQEGESAQATGRWVHKGVQAIPYAPSDGHGCLWDTLEDWSKRAAAPDEWYRSVVKLAADGPQALEPHQRGWVAHVVSTTDGARLFAEAKPKPPADWLCTFDPRQRYATPVSSWLPEDEDAAYDPFPLFSLDADPIPKKADLEGLNRDREIPPNAWSAFRPNKGELLDIAEDNCPGLYGPGSNSAAALTPRMQKLGIWIANCSDEPTALWWAVRKGGLHPAVQRMVRWHIEREDDDGSATVAQLRLGWSYLFESWRDSEHEDRRDWYELQRSIKRDGWDFKTVREFGSLFRPTFTATPAWRAPAPPSGQVVRLGELIHIDVAYLDAGEREPVPAEHLGKIVPILRESLEWAVRLEREIGGYGLQSLSPIIPDVEHADEVGYERSHGLSGLMLLFSSLFKELKETDPDQAMREFHAWTRADDSVFMRLRIWASSDANLVSDQEFGAFIGTMNDDVFWDGHHQRDLLLTISGRWNQLSYRARRMIEKRLLVDKRELEWVPEAEVTSRKAGIALSRIGWLQQNGCDFAPTFLNKLKRLRNLATDWEPSDSAQAAESREARGGTVRTDTTHDFLLTLPLKEVLPAAKAAQGRTEDFLVEADPFRGLAADRRAKAWSALIQASKRGEYEEWAWRAFLSFDIRQDDPPRMTVVIGSRLGRFNPSALSGFVRSATSWLQLKAAELAQNNATVFDQLMVNLIAAINAAPDKATSGVLTSGDRDWVFEAINSPAGRIAEALMDDPRKDGREVGQGFPKSWLSLLEAVLQLPGDHGRYAVVVLCSNLNWFFAIAPDWAKQHLIAFAGSDDPLDRDAFWSGFLRGARVPYQDLYFILKPHLIRFAKEGIFARRGYGDVLAGVLLAGWGSKRRGKAERIVTDDEMRDLLSTADETFRGKVLRQLRIWLSRENTSVRRRWLKSAETLFQTVWPKQKFVRTPATTSALVDLLFTSAPAFSRLVDVVLPLLVPLEEASFTTMPHLRMEARRKKENIISNYPGKTLEVMHAILPDDPRGWPYEANRVLDEIGEADEQLRGHPRFLELMRRWNSR